MSTVSNQILGHAYSLVAISKTINQWAAEEPVREVPPLMLNAGDMVSLSALAQTLAQSIVELAQVSEVKA
jgi:hypothetical protein